MTTQSTDYLFLPGSNVSRTVCCSSSTAHNALPELRPSFFVSINFIFVNMSIVHPALLFYVCPVKLNCIAAEAELFFREKNTHTSIIKSFLKCTFCVSVLKSTREQQTSLKSRFQTMSKSSRSCAMKNNAVNVNINNFSRHNYKQIKSPLLKN